MMGSIIHLGDLDTSDETLRLVSFATIMDEDLPPVDWLVEGLIANGDRVILFGEYGSFKSWLLLHLGLHLADGRKWLDEFEVPHAKKVLYVDEEMNERTLRRRIKQLAGGTGLEAEGVEFQALSLAGVTFDQSGATRLLKALDTSGFNPDVIIVETLRRVLIGSENDSEAIGKFWRNVEPIRQAGKTLIISHHMRKPSGRPGPDRSRDRASGSTDILAGPDTGFAIEKVQQRLITIECVKSRNAEEPRTFGVLVQNTDQGNSVELRFDGYRSGSEVRALEKERATNLILEYFNIEEHSIQATPGNLKQYLKEKGISEKTFERAWKTIKLSEKVEKVSGRLWQLREKYRCNVEAA